MARFTDALGACVARRAHLPADFAAEITQEVRRRVEGTRFTENLPYQMVIARNYATDVARLRRRTVLACELTDPSGKSLLDSRHDGSHLEHDAIRHLTCESLLSRLSPNDREILRLRFWEGRTSKEIGAILGLSEIAVNLRAYRAFNYLRDIASGKNSQSKTVNDK